MDDDNKAVQDDVLDEAKKLGITRDAKPKPDEEEVSDDKHEESDADESEEAEEEVVEDKDESKSDDKNDEADEDEEAEESDEDEDESDEDEIPPPPRKYVPIKKHQAEKAKWATEKQGLVETISKLQTDFETIQSKIPPEMSPARKKLFDELKAADPKFDPTNLNRVLDTLKEELSQSGKVSPELEQKVNAAVEFVEGNKLAMLKVSDERYFNKSWSGFLPSFSKDFPKATEEQKEAARKLMDKVWHTKEFKDKEIDYVYFKNKSKFDGIISPRKKGLETGRTQGFTSADKKAFKLPVAPSAKDLQAAERAMLEAAPDEDDLHEMPDSTL